ncbi:hypothetical protein MJH12_05600, partial [bacterium]|nr:hypothetical protein [bacterium]
MKYFLLSFFIAVLSLSPSFAEDPEFSGISEATTIIEDKLEGSNTEENSESSDTVSATQSEEKKTSSKFYQKSLKGQAVIVRASKIAIPPTAQLIANNLKESFSGMPGTQETLSNFSKKYLL